MLRVTRLLNSLRHHLPIGQSRGSRDAARTPLLDGDAILDLLYRVQAIYTAEEYPRDVEHRRLGTARSVYRGFGLDYEESRPYQAGDELRFMNWRLMARTGQPYMKVFREERRPGLFAVVDRRIAMRFGTRVRLKVTQAARAAAVVAFAARQRNAPVGGVVLEAEPHWVTENVGEEGAFNLVNAASAPCPPLEVTEDEPSLAHMLRILHAMLLRGTSLYLISDFHDLDDSDRPTLLRLATEHRVCAVHIVDPVERELPSIGKLRVAPPGGGDSITVDTSDAATRAAYAAATQQYHAARQQLFTGMDITYVSLTPEVEAIEKQIPLLQP